MELRLTDEQVALRDAARRLLNVRLDAVVAALPEPLAVDARQWLADAAALGWLGLAVPPELGGLGTFGDLAVVHEELGRGLAPSLPTSLAAGSRVLCALPPGPRRDALLVELAAGRALLVPVLPDGVTMRETADGVRLSGVVTRVADAGSATDLLVAARTLDGRVALLRVPAGAVQLVEEQAPTDIRTWTVQLPDVVLPAEAVLADDAAAAVEVARTDAAVLAAARAVGGGRAVLTRTVEHVSTRRQFDRAIGTFQAVQHQLATVATALDGAALTVARAAWAVDADTPDRAVAAWTASLAASEAFADATLVAHQLHGGMGFVLDSPLHLWSARAVADPTATQPRRQVLDALAAATGLTGPGRRVPAQHRAVQPQPS